MIVKRNDQTRQAVRRDILVVSRAYLPRIGGIEEYVYHRCLQEPDRLIMLAAAWPGDRQFDRQQSFPIYRWPALDHVHANPIVSGLAKLVGLTALLFAALRLFARYRYRYIEWGHGYDSSVLWILSVILPTNTIVYLHGHDLIGALRRPLHKWFLKKSITRSQAAVCNSQFTRDHLKQHLDDQVATHIIHPCVRPGRFGQDAEAGSRAQNRHRIRQLLGISDDAIVMLTVGRLVRRKGIDRLIRLVPAVLQTDIDFHYVVCGAGDQSTSLKALVEESKLDGRVHFMGEVSDRELAAFYAACDLVAMVTYFDRENDSIEGYGTVYSEAGYFQKPVLAADAGGVRDVVRHGCNGLLVDPLQPDDVLGALLELCRNADLRFELGKNGKQLAARELDFSAPYRGMNGGG